MSFASESVRVDVIVPTYFISVSLFLLFFNNFVFFLILSPALSSFLFYVNRLRLPRHWFLDLYFESRFENFPIGKRILIFIRTAVSLFPVLYPSPSIVNLKGKKKIN